MLKKLAFASSCTGPSKEAPQVALPPVMRTVLCCPQPQSTVEGPVVVDFFCKRNSNANASGDGTCFIITFIAMNHKYFMSPQSISTS